MQQKKSKILTNLFWLVLVVIIIIPKSRQFIQVTFHKALSFVSSYDLIETDKRKVLGNLNWKLIDETNKVYNLSFEKDRVVFINFWATWCPPCIAEMESLEELYKSYNDRVDFLFITDDDKNAVKKFKTKNNYTFPVFYPMHSIPQQLKTTSIPRTFIINKNGEIVIDKSGVLNWNSSEIRMQLNLLLED